MRSKLFAFLVIAIVASSLAIASARAQSRLRSKQDREDSSVTKSTSNIRIQATRNSWGGDMDANYGTNVNYAVSNSYSTAGDNQADQTADEESEDRIHQNQIKKKIQTVTWTPNNNRVLEQENQDDKAQQDQNQQQKQTQTWVTYYDNNDTSGEEEEENSEEMTEGNQGDYYHTSTSSYSKSRGTTRCVNGKCASKEYTDQNKDGKGVKTVKLSKWTTGKGEQNTTDGAKSKKKRYTKSTSSYSKSSKSYSSYSKSSSGHKNSTSSREAQRKIGNDDAKKL